jgi:glycosyltransferase involved in cell wall biosynthesis
MSNVFEPKVRLVRVVTQAEVVDWHLRNFIERSVDDFDLYIVGDNVSRYTGIYRNVKFVDIKIKRKTNLIYDTYALFKLWFILIKIKPLILHSIMPKSGFLCAVVGFFMRVPIRIHTFTGQVWYTMTGVERFLHMSFDKIIYKLNTFCVTDSPSQSKFLEKNGFRNRFGPIKCLGIGSLSGVNLKIFTLDLIRSKYDVRRDLSIDNDDFVFVFLARKTIVKGIKELIESYAKISNFGKFKLLFIGPDESGGEVERLLNEHIDIKDQIICLDKVKNHERYLVASDVLCLPSRSEGFGSIVIEAAALGIPSIGFNIVGLSDSIEDRVTGILVEPNNVDEFAKSMINLYENPDYLSYLSQNGIKRVHRFFSADYLYNEHKKLYQSLMRFEFNSTMLK